MLMPTPADIDRSHEIQQAQQILRWVESLEKCSGWKEWMKAKVFTTYDAAAQNILAAVARGEPPASHDTTAYQALHPLVDAYRTTLRTAQAKVGLNPQT